ncbi:MAG: hypothetical protein Q7S36_00575 [Candidatus Liptonbacteria bacterium]|nr:hypothetical protein [Candidatus Liptonbacteria bacterium]
MKKLVFAAFLLLLPLAAYGYDKELVFTNRRSFVFENSDCEKTKSCSLKRVEYIVEDYKVGIGDEYTYGAQFFARYETDAVNNLEDYVFVQFIRGCMYWSRVKNGAIVRDYSINYGSATDNVVFNFSDWIVDTDNPDPVYSATAPGMPRHALARWNLVYGSLDPETSRIYARECPRFPELYIVDNPSGAYVKKNGEAKNVSLQFKTCIYKTSDVPEALLPGGPGLGEPLNCHLWNISWVYNHALHAYEHPETLICPPPAK